MKKNLIIFACFLMMSACKSQFKNSDYIVVYKTLENQIQEPEYLIIKSKPQTFELNIPMLYSSIIGEWFYSKDTIVISPKYTYEYRNNKSSLLEINDKDTSVISIKQRFHVKGDILIDITDYSIVHPLLKKDNYQKKFERIGK